MCSKCSKIESDIARLKSHVDIASAFCETFQVINNVFPDETSQLKGGHPPAVKAGGMRITQHKTTHTNPKEPANEDLTGLSGPSPVPSNPVSISGAPNRGNADFTPVAAQVAHSPKPPAHINVAPKPNIQQPRK